MALENRETVQGVLVAKVIEDAPVREVIRVYSEAVTAAVNKLSDDDLVRSIAAAGYTQILDHFGMEVPAESEEEAAAE